MAVTKKSITPDQIASYEEVAGVPFASGNIPPDQVAHIEHEIVPAAKKAMSSPEMALRTIPPLAVQTGAMMAGAKLGGGPGERAASAAASVANDFYQRFLNHMFGEPNAPVSGQHELNSALAGAIAPAVPG